MPESWISNLYYCIWDSCIFCIFVYCFYFFVFVFFNFYMRRRAQPKFTREILSLKVSKLLQINCATTQGACMTSSTKKLCQTVLSLNQPFHAYCLQKFMRSSSSSRKKRLVSHVQRCPPPLLMREAEAVTSSPLLRDPSVSLSNLPWRPQGLHSSTKCSHYTTWHLPAQRWNQGWIKL